MVRVGDRVRDRIRVSQYWTLEIVDLQNNASKS